MYAQILLSPIEKVSSYNFQVDIISHKQLYL